MLQRRDRIVLVVTCAWLAVLAGPRANAQQLDADANSDVVRRSETRPQAQAPAAFGPAATTHPTVRPPLGFTAAVGVRTDLVRSTGLDPFSNSDDIHQTALSVGYRFGEADLPGIAAAFEWNHGSTDARARGADATLTIDRLSLGLEGRFPVTSRLSAFARLAPGLLRHDARLEDASAPPPAYDAESSGKVHQTAWLATGDVSAGLAYRVGILRASGAPVFGFWLAAESGYGYSASRQLVLSPGVETQPGRIDEPVRLGALAYRGAFLRFRLAVAF